MEFLVPPFCGPFSPHKMYNTSAKMYYFQMKWTILTGTACGARDKYKVWWRRQTIFDYPPFQHQEVILNLFGLVCKELNQEMFTRWDICLILPRLQKPHNIQLLAHAFFQNGWPSPGSDQISRGTKQNMEQVWRGIFTPIQNIPRKQFERYCQKVFICLFFCGLGQQQQ